VLGTLADELGPDGLLRIEINRLADERVVQVAGAGDAAGIGRLGARDEPEQRRLAGTVAPDDADPLALADAEGNGVQDRP